MPPIPLYCTSLGLYCSNKLELNCRCYLAPQLHCLLLLATRQLTTTFKLVFTIHRARLYVLTTEHVLQCREGRCSTVLTTCNYTWLNRTVRPYSVHTAHQRHWNWYYFAHYNVEQGCFDLPLCYEQREDSFSSTDFSHYCRRSNILRYYIATFGKYRCLNLVLPPS